MIRNAKNILSMKETGIDDSWIDRYNEGSLDRKEQELFRERMCRDPLLGYEVKLDASLERFLRDADAMDLRNKIVAASKRKGKGIEPMDFLLIAASVICTIMIGGLFYLSGNHDLISENIENGQQEVIRHYLQDERRTVRPGISRSSGAKPAVAAVLKPTSPAWKFVPLPEFELLAGSPVRSGLFRLLSPVADNTVILGDTVNFSWCSGDTGKRIVLVVLDNTGSTVSMMDLPADGSYAMGTGRFGPGLYYWKILAEQDLLFMGKLTILDGLKSR